MPALSVVIPPMKSAPTRQNPKRGVSVVVINVQAASRFSTVQVIPVGGSGGGVGAVVVGAGIVGAGVVTVVVGAGAVGVVIRAGVATIGEAVLATGAGASSAAVVELGVRGAVVGAEEVAGEPEDAVEASPCWDGS